MTHSQLVHGFAAACVLGFGASSAANADMPPGTSDGVAGEGESRSHFEQHREELAALLPGISETLADAATTQRKLKENPIWRPTRPVDVDA
ncbi:hypothetical protein [Piscinibacter sakaiensis]|uniref:hypothetical protein n=1 Tax=Piscinibacter sakaiensis TaxID=1547922 RepID=UPI003AABDC50